MAAKFSWIVLQLFAVWIRICRSSCGDHLEGYSGDLRFPISGGNVGESLRCTWTITVSERFRVKITFTDFVMETICCSCTHDFLEIRDGSLDNSTVIGRFCAKRQPKFIYSTTNVIWIQFTSDFRTYSSNRFRLSYEAVCGSHYTDSSGTLRSPRYSFPYENKDCIYSIEVPKGRIKVKFESFRVNGRMPVCLYDFLEVKEIGYFVLSNSQGESRRSRYCGINKPPIIYSTKGSILWFRFKRSDDGKSRFIANYRTIFVGEGTCGGTFKDTSGLIYSQNYPYHFPHGQECVWKIRVDPNMHAHLYFDTLNFGNKMDGVCGYGHLEIYDGSEESSFKIGEYCGNVIPNKIISRTNELMIKAVSSYEGKNMGWFSLHYESSTGSVCGMSKFTCANRQCIENDKECNGQKDCEDGSDEEVCPEQTSSKDPGFLSWYRFWPVSIVGGMLIVGVWLWRAWKKIMAARSEVDRPHATTPSPNHLEMLPCTSVEPPSYNEAVAENVEPPPSYEEALRERLNPQNSIQEPDSLRVHSDLNTGNMALPRNVGQTLSMVVYEGSSTSSHGSPYDSHRKRGYTSLHLNAQSI